MTVSKRRPSGSSTIDADVLVHLAGGLPPGGLEDVLTMFLEELRIRAGALERALESGYLSKLRALAHAISGSASTFGAPRLARMAERLGELAAAGDTGRVGDAGRELIRHVPVVASALDQHLGGARRDE